MTKLTDTLNSIRNCRKKFPLSHQPLVKPAPRTLKNYVDARKTRGQGIYVHALSTQQLSILVCLLIDVSPMKWVFHWCHQLVLQEIISTCKIWLFCNVCNELLLHFVEQCMTQFLAVMDCWERHENEPKPCHLELEAYQKCYRDAWVSDLNDRLV